MTTQNPPRRFTPMSQFATDYPVLVIDSHAPIRELHNVVSERLSAVLPYLQLMGCTSVTKLPASSTTRKLWPLTLLKAHRKTQVLLRNNLTKF